MAIIDEPQPVNPYVLGNIGATLATHLIAHLLHKKVLTIADVEEIFRDTRKRYTSIPEEPGPITEWEKQATSLLDHLQKDALVFGSR